jgi:hypothetical protein
MTNKQRLEAREIAESIDYTGFPTLIVQANGRWVSPASSAHDPDCLVFEWGWIDEEGRAGYTLVPRAGDEIHENGRVSEILTRTEAGLQWRKL